MGPGVNGFKELQPEFVVLRYLDAFYVILANFHPSLLILKGLNCQKEL